VSLEQGVFEMCFRWHTVRAMIRAAAALVAFSLALGVVALAQASASKQDRRAKLAIVTKSPLTIRGTQFRSREGVHVKGSAGDDRFARRTTASRIGAFTLQFPTVTVDRCSTLIAVAIGSRGSQATIKYFEPLCPPQ
jgi:hypothetical protein